MCVTISCFESGVLNFDSKFLRLPIWFRYRTFMQSNSYAIDRSTHTAIVEVIKGSTAAAKQFDEAIERLDDKTFEGLNVGSSHRAVVGATDPARWPNGGAIETLRAQWNASPRAGPMKRCSDRSNRSEIR